MLGVSISRNMGIDRPYSLFLLSISLVVTCTGKFINLLYPEVVVIELYLQCFFTPSSFVEYESDYELQCWIFYTCK